MANNETNNSTHQPLTHALEALLGGLGPIPDIPQKIIEPENSSLHCDRKIQNLISENISKLQQMRNTYSTTDVPISQDQLDKSPSPCTSNIQSKELSSSEMIVLPTEQTPTEITGIEESKINPVGCQSSIANTTQDTTPVTNQPANGTEFRDSMIISSRIAGSENPKIPGLFLCGNIDSNEKVSRDNLPQNRVVPQNDTSILTENDTTPNSPSKTIQVSENCDGAQLSRGTYDDEKNAEWENDSSPIEDTTDESDSSSESTSDDSEDGEDSFKLLSTEEQAKILMAGEGVSDDESGDKSKGQGGQLRTKNEVPEVFIPKPDVTITQDMPIRELGCVEQIVDNIILIKAKVSGEYRVLESGSFLCLWDRSNIGVIAETMGPVQQPLYSVLFSQPADIATAGISIGVRIFYSEMHSTYVLTKALKAFKGSDASNINDEEVGDDELEFSDDEAEAEYKRRIKQKRQENRNTKITANENSRRGRNTQQQSHSSVEIKNFQDTGNGDNEYDGPYRPLARPAGYADHVGRIEAPAENSFTTRQGKQSSGDRNRGRGRGDRHRPCGSSGRGRGGKKRRGIGSSAAPRSSYQQDHGQVLDHVTTQNSNLGLQSHGLSQTIPPQVSFANAQRSFTMPQYEEYNPQQPCPPMWPHIFPQVNTYSPSNPYLNNQTTPNWVNLAQLLPNGGFINPAFFNTLNNPPHPRGHSNQDME